MEGGPLWQPLCFAQIGGPRSGNIYHFTAGSRFLCHLCARPEVAQVGKSTRFGGFRAKAVIPKYAEKAFTLARSQSQRRDGIIEPPSRASGFGNYRPNSERAPNRANGRHYVMHAEWQPGGRASGCLVLGRPPNCRGCGSIPLARCRPSGAPAPAENRPGRPARKLAETGANVRGCVFRSKPADSVNRRQPAWLNQLLDQEASSRIPHRGVRACTVSERCR